MPVFDIARMVGSDISPKAIDASIFNNKMTNEQFGKMHNLNFYKGDFEQVYNSQFYTHEKNIVIASNIPYGNLVDNSDLNDTFKRFGEMIKNNRNRIRDVMVLSGYPKFERLTRLRWNTLLSFKNRGYPVRLLNLENSENPQFRYSNAFEDSGKKSKEKNRNNETPTNNK
mmetsp:Transcript_12595/g.14016  ORF Transcript_12595/g.14016 Transcript_12595/m.14016 type:complete len:170 (+) Transcript_12595:370-879(+)